MERVSQQHRRFASRQNAMGVLCTVLGLLTAGWLLQERVTAFLAEVMREYRDDYRVRHGLL